MGLSSEFWAAIAGAIVGGLMSALLQWVSARATAKTKVREELARQQALARTLLFKIIKIESDFVQFRSHVDECRAQAAVNGMPYGWTTLIPLANLPRDVFFAAEEMGALIGIGDDALFNDVIGLDDVHNGAIQSLEFYRARRLALSDALPADMTDMVGTIELTREQYRSFAPKIAEVDQLAQEISSYVDQETSEPLALARRLTGAINQKFSLKLEIAPKEPRNKQAPEAAELDA